MRRRTFLSLSLVALMLPTLFSFAVFSGLDNDVLSQTNQFRKSKGKTALVMRDDLNRIAEKHSENMARGRVSFGHGGFNSRFAAARQSVQGMNNFAENVAYGATTGKEVVADWKKSPGHRKNLLGNFKYIGIGTAKDKNGRMYYTQVFAD